MTASKMTVTSLVSLSLFSAASALNPTLTVPEGYVGVTYTFGSLDNHIYLPGMNLRRPWPVTSSSQIEVRPQTDRITDAQCGAKDGTRLTFPLVEIGNQLRQDMVLPTIRRYGENYDQYLVMNKVRAEIFAMCSRMTSEEIYIDRFSELDDHLLNFLRAEQEREIDSGVNITHVRLAKPILPRELQAQYDKLAEEKVARKVAEQATARIEQENTNALLTARGLEEQAKQTAEFANAKLIAAKKAEQEQAAIANEIAIAVAETGARAKRIEAEAEATAILAKAQAQASANRLLHTPEYIELQRITATLGNAKHFIHQGAPPSVNLFDGNIPKLTGLQE